MADRAKKITELDALTAPADNDLLVIVDAVANNVSNTVNYTTKNVTVGNLLNNVASNVTISNTNYLSANNLVIRRKTTPVVSSGTSDKQGSIWFDDNYIYVATANGTIKRAALSTF